MAPRRLAFLAAAALLAGAFWLRNLLSLSWQLPVLRRDRAPVTLPPTRKHLELDRAYGLDAGTFTSTKTFPLQGESTDQGTHYRLLNAGVLTQTETLEQNALLVVVVFTDRRSWGPGRSVESFFAMLHNNSSYPTERISVTLLTSNSDEFRDVRDRLYDYVSDFAQFSLIFRNDFQPTDDARAAKLGAHARYRNFAVLSTLEPWHQHVVWMDPDVYSMPRDLLTKMVAADRDIVVPLCAATRDAKPMLYDSKAWVGSPESLEAISLSEYRNGEEELVALDYIGGTMLYVKADVHRQGVIFPYQSAVVDKQGPRESDRVDAEGLCYEAHHLGYKCWGLPFETVLHYDT